MSVTDAEILDTVRRLRSYMITLDNCHLVINGLSNIEDKTICTSIENILPDIIATSKKISVILKTVETSRLYRNMLKNFNMNEQDIEKEF